MHQVSYTHPQDSKTARYVVSGGRTHLLQPGETLMVDVPEGVTQLDEKPSGKAAKKGKREDGEPPALTDLLKGKVADITAQLPKLDAAALNELLSAEKVAATPRSSLIGEIEAELLKKAAA